MKASKNFLLKRGYIPVRRFRVPSNSKKGKVYLVEIFKDGHYECTCPAGAFKRVCKHKQRVAEYLEIL